MKIRLLREKDIENAAKIVRLNYSRKYEKSATLELKEMFGNSVIKPKYFIAEDRGEILGFAGFIQSWMDYDVYQIFWVNVLPKQQGKGIGKSLVEKIINEIKKKKDAAMILLTADSDVKNNEYYKNNFGFKTIQLFEDNKTSHLMSLPLK